MKSSDHCLTRADLIRFAEDLGILEDISERAWLCKQLGVGFDLDISNQELVALAVDAGVDFNKRS